VIFTLYGGFVFAGVHYGIGRHNNSLPQDQEIQALKVTSESATEILVKKAEVIQVPSSRNSHIHRQHGIHQT
jgi:hypothetical protein